MRHLAIMNAARDAEIAQLLAASTAAHVRYRQFSPHQRQHNGKLQQESGDAIEARAALDAAYQFRLRAHEMDPLHDAQIWQDEPVADTDLMDFYRQQLGL